MGEQVRTLTHCGHRFHVLCIDNWFQRNVHCPLCRHDIRDGLTTDVTQILEQMDDETLRRIQMQTYDVSGETVMIETTIYLSGGEEEMEDDAETIPYSESEGEGY